MSYDTTVLADNPIRYYKCDETSGTSIADSGSQGQNGTISGSYTLNQTALASGLGSCIQFSGGNVSLPTTSLPSGSHVVSIECWISCISIPGSFPRVLSLGSNSQDQQNEIDINGFGPNFYFSLNNDDLGGHSASTATTYYLLAVWDGTKQQFYVGTGGTVTNYNRTPGGTPNLTYGSATIAPTFSTGYISNVAIYDTALSSSQATAHYNAGITSSGSTSSRTIPATAALELTSSRTISGTAALELTSTRTIPCSAALELTSAHTIPCDSALELTSTRTISATAALKQTSTRTISCSAALELTSARTITCTAALEQTSTRTIPSTAALELTSARTVPATASICAQRAIPCSAALEFTGKRTIPCTASLSSAASIPPTNAILYVRSGKAALYVRKP